MGWVACSMLMYMEKSFCGHSCNLIATEQGSCGLSCMQELQVISMSFGLVSMQVLLISHNA